MLEFDYKEMMAAAERFDSRVKTSVSRAITARAILGADAPVEDRRKQRLQESASQDRARATVFEAEARGMRRDPHETVAELASERIIGSNDLVGLPFLELAVALSRGVCRIRIGSAAGTGVLVGPGVLMTNNHVIRSEEEARQAEAQFDYQENQSGDLLPVQNYRMKPDRFFVTDPKLDFTLIALEPGSRKGVTIDIYPWVRLIADVGKAEKGDPLNIIQHPRGDLKQIALRNNDVIEVPDGKPDFLYYTTDTEPGSSGSPCFSNQWEIVALHHRSVPATADGEILKKNGEPWVEGVDDPALISWIANEGTRISALVAALQAASVEPHERELRDRLLAEEPPNPVELARRAAKGESARVVVPTNAPGMVTAIAAAGGAAATATLQVPLSITFSLGTAAATPEAAATGEGAATAGGVGTDVLAEAVKIDPNWENRQGYDESFLGVKIPLPRLSASMKKITVKVPAKYQREGDPYVLDYHHYSVAMNSDRCFAWYSAAIIDGDNRPKLTRGRDKWFIDERIEKDPKNPDYQCGEELYATARTDRGHLTRYLDVAWGANKQEALNATYDTFHFTNCCLQLSEFNQRRHRWQGIEQFLLEKKARKEDRRIVVITGPVFSDTDPYYQNEFMDYAIPIPLEFWKVCAIIREDGTLSATGFILGQKDVRQLPGFEEAFDVNVVQFTLKELERRTKLKFGVLTQNDHLADGGAPGTLEVSVPGGGKRPVMPIQSYEDIVV